jgi:hypothetical protein
MIINFIFLNNFVVVVIEVFFIYQLDHDQGYVQFLQNPILYYTMDKQNVFLTIVGYNLNEIHVHNYQMQYLIHYHWLVMDLLDIQ